MSREKTSGIYFKTSEKDLELIPRLDIIRFLKGEKAMVIVAVDSNKQDLKLLVKYIRTAFLGCAVVMFTSPTAAGAVGAVLTFLLTTGWSGIAFANIWTLLVAVFACAAAYFSLKGEKEETDSTDII